MRHVKPFIEQTVQNNARGRGRPRQFDEKEALDAALHVFWAKGYDGATIDDLVEAMGIGRPSLYGAFGDKEALFARCLEHYGGTIGSKTMAAFHAAKDVHSAVRAFLRQAVVNFTGRDTPPGCIVLSVAPAVADARVRARVRASCETGVAQIAARLRRAVREGELPREFPVAHRARAVIDASSALSLRARLGARRSELLAHADEWARLLLTSVSHRRAA